MKNQKVLVIQLTRDESRIALMKTHPTTPVLLDSIVLPTPEGAVTDGMINDFQAMEEVLDTAIETLGCGRIRKAIFVMCTSHITSVTTNMPKVPQKQLEKMLTANMDVYFPVDTNQYHMTWQVLREVKNESGQSEYEVKIWATSKDILEGYYKLANACELVVEAVDYCGHSQASVVDAYYTDYKMSKDSFFTLSLTSKKPKTEEVVPETYEEDDEFTMDIIQIDKPEIEVHLAVMKEFVLTTLLLQNTVQMQRMTPYTTAYDVASDIAMTIEYFMSTNQEYAEPECIYISSADEEDECLEEELSNMMNLPVRYLFTGDDLQWALCRGAAQTQIDYGNPSMNNIKFGALPLANMNVNVEKGLLVASGIIFVGAMIFSISPRASWKETLNDLETERIELAAKSARYNGAADEYNAYAAEYDSYSQDWETVFSSIRTYNDNLNLVLEELEKRLPEDVSVTKLGITADGISVEFAAESKRLIAYTIMTMRDLQYSSLDGISNVTGGDADGEGGVGVIETGSRSTGSQIYDGQKSLSASALKIGEEAAPLFGSKTNTASAFSQMKSNLSADDEKELYAQLALLPSTEKLESKYGKAPGSGTINGNPSEEKRKEAMERLVYSNPFAVNEVLNGIDPAKRAEITDAASLNTYIDSYVSILLDNVALGEVYLKDMFPNSYKWYTYCLNNPDAAAESLYYLDSSKVDSACNKPSTWPGTGDSAIDNILKTYLEYDESLVNGSSEDDNPSGDNNNSSNHNSSGNNNGNNSVVTPSDNGVEMVQVSPQLWEMVMEKAGLTEYNLKAPERVPKDVYDAMKKWYIQSKGGTEDVPLPDVVYDWFVQEYGADLFPDGSADGAGGVFEEDGRYFITLEFSYKEELIQAELQRKGLFYWNKLQKLEVQ